jgi:P27 family predicted phage terminase small subunit
MAARKNASVVKLMTDASYAQPPAHLGEDGKELWNNIQRSYRLDDPGGLALLQVACEARDRVSSCRQQLDLDGEVIEGVRGDLRAHPAAQIERDARSAMIRALKELRLDVEPLRDRPGRPGGSAF